MYAANLNGSITAYTYRTVFDDSQLRTIIIYIVTVWFCLPAAADHRYVVRVDTALETLHVSAYFVSPVEVLRARHGAAGRFLVDAADCETGRPLLRRGRSLSSPQDAIPCIDYVVDLRGAAAAERRGLQ